MKKVLSQTYTIAHTYRRDITSVLLFACIVTALFYVVNLYQVITNTVALQQISRDTRSLNTSVQNLDSQYLGLSKAITADSIQARGYEQVTVSAFISRTTLGRVALVGHEL